METHPTSIQFDDVLAHSGTILSRVPLTAESSPAQWSYALSLPLDLDRHARGSVQLPLRLRVRVRVESGELGCVLVADDWVTLLGSVSASATKGDHTVDLLWDRGDGCAHLVFRNQGPGEQSCVFTVKSVELSPVQAGRLPPTSRLEEVLPEDLRHVDIARLQRAVTRYDAAPDDEEEIFAALRRKWSTVPAGLSNRRGTDELLSLPDDALRDFWIDTHREATAGDGFPVRGWYQTLYRDVLRGKRVLEIGSGMGIDGIEFARHGARTTFVDIVEDNLAVMRRLCAIFDIEDATFLYLDGLAALDTLDADYDVVWCQGSLINAPFNFVKRECAAIVPHLRPGGRWIELAYPCERWVRDGQLPFRQWGNITDGEGTPWMEWYDLGRVLRRLAPASFVPVLAMNFHHDDFNWFDLVRVD